MQELSMNILDIAENSVRAGATLVEIRLCQFTESNSQTLIISDDGHGMNPETAQNAADPFCTSRNTRDVGLGLPFLKMAAELTGGTLCLESSEGVGTTVKAEFTLDHIDLAPLGDMPGTLSALAQANPHIDFVFAYVRNEASFTFDTRDAKAILGDVPLSEPAVAVFIRNYIDEGMQSVYHT